MRTTYKKLTMGLAISTLVMLTGITQADDIDIYYTNNSNNGSEPIVMFSLDWRPNLGATACLGNVCDFLKNEIGSDGLPYLPNQASYTYFDLLRAALKKVMDPLAGLRVGLMLNHDYKRNCSGKVQPGCSNGGYIGLGAQSFVQGDANGAKATFHEFLQNIPTPQGNASHKYQGKELFFEMFRYLTGQEVLNGHVGYLDYNGYPENTGGGGSSNNINVDVENPSIAWDSTIENLNRYNSPLEVGYRCTKIFTLNFMFQVAQQDSDSDSAIEDSIPNGGFGVSGMREFEDVIGYLNDADLANGNYGTAADIEGVQNVTSYFLTNNQNVKTNAYAQAGGTGSALELSADPQALVELLKGLFDEILSVSTTFVSASVPINAFNRAEIVDNVFIAMFKTDPDGKPLWTGNVKKLRIADTGDGSGNIELTDANGNPAISADGRIKFNALTYWTNSGALPPADPDENEVEGRDGRSTTRGGTGQKMPGMLTGGAAGPGLNNAHSGGRKLYYDKGNNLEDLNADLTTAADLQLSFGALTPAESLELIKYARGLDVNDEDNDGEKNEARAWMHADTLHSRPLPINYGATGGYSESNQRIYITYGTNDGFMRMVENTTAAGGESGKEIWAFMPKAVMGEVKKLKANAGGTKHPYMVDGAPSVYIEGGFIDPTSPDTQDVILYFGLRRGGKAYYAIDITNPEAPDLLWSIGNSGDFSRLGMTFSNPEIGKMPDGNDDRPIVMFGGGYDTNKDLRSGVGTNDSEGNAIYVVDGKTGDLIWKAVGSGSSSSDTFVHSGLVDSVPSTVTAVDTNGDSYTDRIYAGDSGGRVWRVDMHGEDTGDWKLTLLADLGRHYAANVTNDRRFFHRPDVVQSKDANGAFDAVVIGSGDRADPLDQGGVVENFTYMIKDRNTGLNTGADTSVDHADLGDVTNTCLQQGSPCTADLTYGWRLGLTDNGEKNLSSALTIAGTVFFSTYLPPDAGREESCGPAEGSGRFYAVKLANAAAAQNLDTTTDEFERSRDSNADGIPSEAVYIPSSVDAKGRVMHNDYSFDDAGSSSRLRTFWLETENEDL